MLARPPKRCSLENRESPSAANAARPLEARPRLGEAVGERDRERRPVLPDDAVGVARGRQRVGRDRDDLVGVRGVGDDAGHHRLRVPRTARHDDGAAQLLRSNAVREAQPHAQRLGLSPEALVEPASRPRFTR